MATSNTKEVFREAVGKRIVGLFTTHGEIAGTTTVLVLDDGTGVAVASNGSHWSLAKKEVKRRVYERRRELEALQADLRDVIASEGALAAPSSVGGEG